MKKYISFLGKSAALALTMAAVGGCASELNVEPNNTIDAVDALKTASDVKGALIGCYDGLGSNDFAAGAIQYIPDLISDNGDILFRGSFTTILEIWRKDITTTGTQPLATWNDGFETLNRANNVLANLEKLDTDEERLAVEGEARFIRGFVLFNLVRLYARPWGDGDEAANPGVPMPLTPTEIPVNQAVFLPRSTVAEVYAQVIDDLTTAEENLADGNINANGASAAAAAAILTRVYLSQENYAEARDAANRVLESGQFELELEYKNVFNDYLNRKGVPSSESILSSMITIQDGVNDLTTFYAASEFGGRGDIRIQSQHLAIFDEDDVRGQFYYEANNGATHTSKYMDQFSNVTIVRLAEMYLTRAECNLRLKTQVGARPVEDINIIRRRAGLAPTASVNLAEILKQRRLELCFEGEELFDLRRTKREITEDLPYNAPNTILPIPQREMDTNGSLVQNDAYADN